MPGDPLFTRWYPDGHAESNMYVLPETKAPDITPPYITISVSLNFDLPVPFGLKDAKEASFKSFNVLGDLSYTQVDLFASSLSNTK